jgi:hypothetical protein
MTCINVSSQNVNSNTALFAGALDHLMRHALTGCEHAAHHAVQLLDCLSDRPDVDSETRSLCGRMCELLEAERLETGHV